jgi:molybdopterin/thiamine biosynthesis adenylyltransferase
MAFSQEKISNSVVGVAGQGGLGGGVAMLLARLGVRHLKICDPDSFETSNINRQLGAAPHTVGKNKATVVGELIRETVKDVTVDIYPEGMQKHVAADFVDGCDLIIDCIDFYNVDERYDLHREFRASSKCKGCLAGTVVGWGANIYLFTKDGLTLEDFYGIPPNTEQTEEIVDKLVRLQASFLPRFPTLETLYDWMRETGNVPILAVSPPLGQYLMVTRAALMLTDLDQEPYCAELPPMPKYLWMDASTFECGVYEFNGEFVNREEHQRLFGTADVPARLSA